MPLNISSQTLAALFTISSWSVNSDAHFVEALAWLYLQKPDHADSIVKALSPEFAGLYGGIFDGAIDLLKYDVHDLSVDLASTDKKISKAAKKKLDARISHRDGLLFQNISWLAAAKQFPGALKAAPHVRPADKGFDGVLLNIGLLPTEVLSLVICEDKASVAPRPIVLKKVWPEMEIIIAGKRDLEIMPVITSLLSSVKNKAEIERILVAVSWKKIMQFRVSLAVGNDQEKKGKYHHLFKGFDKAHPAGKDITRLAEIMPMNDVRQFLQEIADKVILKLLEMQKNV